MRDEHRCAQVRPPDSPGQRHPGAVFPQTVVGSVPPGGKDGKQVREDDEDGRPEQGAWEITSGIFGFPSDRACGVPPQIVPDDGDKARHDQFRSGLPWLEHDRLAWWWGMREAPHDHHDKGHEQEDADGDARQADRADTGEIEQGGRGHKRDGDAELWARLLDLGRPALTGEHGACCESS